MTTAAHEKSPATPDGGFWRLRHDHLAALLARDDLSWRKVRVYLALADLIEGYQKPHDAVSINQIAERAGMFYTDKGGKRQLDRRHVSGALSDLAKLGLCGSEGGRCASHEKAVRWVVWPPPPLSGHAAKAGSSPAAKDGARAAARAGLKATAGIGSRAAATRGAHQEVVQEDSDKEKRKKVSADTDSLSPPVLQRGQDGNAENSGNGNDVDRVIAFAFPGGASEKQRAAVGNAITNAIRQGASYPLLAHAVGSPKAQGETPWERIEEAGKRTAALLASARHAWPDFKGEALLDLLTHIPPGWKPAPVAASEGERESVFSARKRKAKEQRDSAREIDAWREQAAEWPKVAPVAGVRSQEHQNSPGAAGQAAEG
jgi:hypothetical protein